MKVRTGGEVGRLGSWEAGTHFAGHTRSTKIPVNGDGSERVKARWLGSSEAGTHVVARAKLDAFS